MILNAILQPIVHWCFSRHLSMDKIAIKFPVMRPAFDEYKDLLNKTSADDYQNTTLRAELNGIYYNFTGFIQDQNLTVDQDYDLMFDCNYRSIAHGLMRHDNGSIAKFIITDTKPIQSKLDKQ